MRIKTHVNNALYQITAVCFEPEHELVIAELQLVLIFYLSYKCRLSGGFPETIKFGWYTTLSINI